MFSKSMKSKFKEFGEEKKFEEIKKIYTQHQDRFIKRLEPLSRRPTRLFGQNGLNYIQMALHRSKSLIEGVMFSFKNDNILIAVLSIRAHFEVTGGVAYLLKKLENYHKKNINEKQLDDALMRLTVGSRDTGLEKYIKSLKKYGLEEIPMPINIMSMVDAADDLYKKYSKKDKPIYRDSYDLLSEFCHPNDYGFQLTKMLDNGTVIYYDSTVLDESHFGFLNYFLITASSFITFYDKVYDLLEEKEELPIIVRN